MHGLKQTYTAGKSRREHHDHRTIAQVGKAACPSRSIPPAGRGIDRIARAEPSQGKCHRKQQDTAGQCRGAPIEPFDQEVKQWRKEKRAQRRGRLYDANGEPAAIGLVVLGDQQRDDHQSAGAFGQADHDAVGERQLPQILRKGHAEKAGRHEQNPWKNDAARAQVVGPFTKEDAAHSPAEHAKHVRQRGRRARPAEFRLDGPQK